MRRRRIDDYLGTGGQERSVKKVLERLEELEERLERIEARLDEMEGLLRALLRVLSSSGRGVASQRGKGGIKDRLSEFLESRKVLFASESRQTIGVAPSKLISIARDAGLVTLDLGGDIAVFTGESFHEFLSMLSSIETSDPEEAASILGAYGRVFSMLRRSGNVYYDHRSGRWKLLK